MKIQRVKIAPDIDGIEALYIDGQLEVQGDEYHDDIGSYIDGFIDGLHTAGISDKTEVWEFPMDEDELALNFDGPPAMFQMLPKERIIRC